MISEVPRSLLKVRNVNMITVSSSLTFCLLLSEMVSMMALLLASVIGVEGF